MKRCPQCRRDYFDDSLSFCLEDGSPLVYGVSDDDPATAILPESATKAQIYPTDQASDPTPQTAASRKNSLIAGAVGILLVTTLGIGSYFYYSRGSGKQIESIAVMPFANDSGNADVEYLSDGMTETLIRNLSQLPNLNVKSRSSVFRYKDANTDVRTIGKELGVQAVLNGRVVQRGERLSLSLELIDVQTDNVIWTDQYERKATDLVTLQNEIARDVSSKLKIKLSGDDQRKLTKNYTDDPEAYRLYLQGRFYWNKRAGREFNKAEGFFRQAVERDPEFALGYVGLADIDEDTDRPKKKEYIFKALALDDQLAEAHASLGYQYMMDYDFSASERELNRAIELDPRYASAHKWNGARLMMLGRYDEALKELTVASELDPTSAGIKFGYGNCLFLAGRTNESIQVMKALAEAEPTLPWAHSFLALIYRQQGDYASSVEERAKSFELEDRPNDAKLARESFEQGGWNGFLHQIVKLYIGPSSARKASFQMELGEREVAINTLMEGAQRGDYWLFTIRTDPVFAPLRGDSRFDELVKKFDLPQ